MCFKVKQTTTAKETEKLSTGSTKPIFGSNVASNIKSDLSIGIGLFSFGNRAKQNQKMSEAGYSQAAIDDYNKRTDASIQREKDALAKKAAMDAQEGDGPSAPNVAVGSGSGTGTGGGGIPSTVTGIINQPVETALSYQEQLAQNEIQRARQDRTRRKAEALRRRLEGGRRGLSLLRRGGARGYA